MYAYVFYPSLYLTLAYVNGPLCKVIQITLQYSTLYGCSKNLTFHTGNADRHSIERRYTGTLSVLH